MPKRYHSEIRTYKQAAEYLGSKRERPAPYTASKNVRIARIFTMLERDAAGELTGATHRKPQPTAEIVVTLHRHVIVRFTPGNIEFPYDGQFKNSPTTKNHRAAFGGPWRV